MIQFFASFYVSSILVLFFFLLLESAKFILVEYMQGAQKLAVATENKYKRHR